MAYTRDQKDPLKLFVEKALHDYQNGTSECAAGYDILRYSSQGLIGVDKSVDPNVFVDWYPLHQGYVLLRLGKQGKLHYKRKE